MLVRVLCILAILHGTVFVGAGNAFEHIVHQMDAAAVAGGDQHQHHQHEMASMEEVEEGWINCVFCLDGVAPAGLYIPDLALDLPAGLRLATALSCAGCVGAIRCYSARAPPAVS